MRVGVACFSLTSAALRAFGADAVRECLRWLVHNGASITGCSDLLLCEKHALKRMTPSIAADRCRLLVRTSPKHRTSALRQQQRKEKQNGATLLQCIPARMNNRRTAKKHAPYRTRPKHCISASATGSIMQCHLCTNLHARNPFPAPARSAVKRTPSVTTGHTPHNVLSTCTVK